MVMVIIRKNRLPLILQQDVHTCCSVRNKPRRELISGVVLNLYSSTKLLSLPQNATNARIRHTSAPTWSQNISVEISKTVIRHSRNLLFLLLHSNLKSFTCLLKEQTHVRYSTVQKIIIGNKPGQKGIFQQAERDSKTITSFTSIKAHNGDSFTPLLEDYKFLEHFFFISEKHIPINGT